ncbi:uncharacterized protein APUU_21268A [Aspergillus puulaauensis]|uniref:Uncharacterized protein n=1 Tax=Aspergillus puulaauensis TaxID=1220207 RepID=A0A7R7XG73_9EURO|nr:uncharacterized protein APUU_21268A [Aspergillus puulaauensis]BCS20836.1 hypothetical protein APUU_21268A [Aspergillus puulaauensis]
MPDVIEPLSQPLFWVLAIVLIAFWLMTVQAAPNTTAIINPSKTWNVVYLKWLEPHLTSALRKFGVLTVYLGILGLQLLEGWWILQLDFTLFRGLRQFSGRSMNPVVICAAMGVWTIFIAVNLVAGALILVVQLTCIGDILSMHVRHRQLEKAVR